MTLTPPYYLSGEAGKTLGAEGYQLANLGIIDAMLTLRSLDADTLQFSLRDNGNRPAIPDDGQWLTLKDDAGQVLFTGIAKRSFRFPERIYSYECANVYKGLGETSLLGDDGRPFLLYVADEIEDRLRDLLTRASNAGLPLASPAAGDMPTFYLCPKMAFRSGTYAAALEDVLKWVPDAVTAMDYSTTPPTLRFHCRGQSTPVTIDLDADNHKATSIDLTALPEARALGVELAYQRRDGDNLLLYLTQTAGDTSAEARRKLSIYLSGGDRTDSFVAEALTTAQKAVAMAQASVDAVGAAITATAASAQIPLTWAGILPLDSNLGAAVAAQPGYSMYASSGTSITLYQGSSWSGTPPSTYTTTIYPTAVALRTSGGALATGWYPITSGAFTAGELATAGATKETRYIKGSMVSMRLINDGDVGMASIQGAGATSLAGWIDGYGGNQAGSDDDWRKYVKYDINIAVDAIDMAPSAVAAAVTAAAGSGSSALITRAEFVEAPPDLAANYFARQDWTPYKGSIDLAPSAPYIPVPGDFINITGTDTPAEWATMAAPVFETQIDLRTGAPRIGIGPSPRQDFSSLIDRLRIPAEDNYQPG